MLWQHYVGGFYSPAKFIAEAKRHGVSRRVAPNIAKSMSFGDTVQLLSWCSGEPAAFAEFLINRITLDHEIAGELGEELIEEGRARLVERGGGFVTRECGSYSVGATYEVDIDLKEVVERAMALAEEKGLPLSFMIAGPLTRTFDPPVELIPPPPFTRGFIRVGRNGEQPALDDPQLVGIESYKRRKQKERRDIQLTLGI